MASVVPDPGAAPAPAAKSHDLTRERGGTRAATARAIIIAVILSLLVTAWAKQAELVTLTSQISESTPPIAAILGLFLLLGAAGLLGKIEQWARGPAARGPGHPGPASCEDDPTGGPGSPAPHDGGPREAIGRWARKLKPNPGEMLVVFVFLAITAAMPGVGLFRQVMPCLMVTQYFGMPTNHLDEMAAHIPTAWAPTDPEVARVFWEGGDTPLPTLGMESVPVIGPLVENVYRFVAGPLIIPWQHWLTPFLVWSLYLSAYFVSAFCFITLFRRSWEEDERLSFPVSSFSVEMIRPEGSLLSGHSFFRDPVVWIGFSLAFVYNLMNALKVFNPSLPALGISYPLGALFTESPWNTMGGFSIFYKPEILGLGYLVPSDVLFSIWFFTIGAWIVRPFAKMAGYQPSGFPFMTQQAQGAFMLLAGYFIWQSRHRLLEVVQKATGGAPHVDDSQEPLPYAVSFWVAVVGMLIVFTMPILFGVAWWMSVMYFGIMFAILLVYCRNRAEMGFPVVWGYPLYNQRDSMLSFLGSAAFLPGGNSQSFTLLTMFSWLQRSVNQAITSAGIEGFVSAQRLGQSRRTLAKVVIAALVFGLMSSFLVNLASYYEYGGLVLSSPGGNEGGQMTQEVLGQFTSISQFLERPEPANPRKMGYTIAGAVIVLGLILGRRQWVQFPFHAGGYALANCHGGPYMWFPAFVLWLTKSLTLRLGGVKLYRRIAPGFLAFTLGHFFSVGLWSLIGLWAGEWVRRYIVWFL